MGHFRTKSNENLLCRDAAAASEHVSEISAGRPIALGPPFPQPTMSLFLYRFVRACKDGNTEIISELLADPDFAPNDLDEKGFADIHYAAWRGHSAAIALLLADPSVDPGLAALPATPRCTSRRAMGMKMLLEP